MYVIQLLSLVLARSGIVDLAAHLASLLGPGEVSNGDDEEAVRNVRGEFRVE